MSKLVVLFSLVSLLALAGCAGSPASSSDSSSSADTSAGGPQATSSPSSSAPATCDQTQLFVKQGLAQDMRDTLGASFIKGGYEIHVPGALIAYDSYGGDMIQAPLGTSASAANVFTNSPGGAFFARIAGSTAQSDRFATQGFTAAKALFDAMAGAAETSTTEQGLTTTVRTSKASRFSCQEVTQSGAVKSASCSFSDLLMLDAVSWPQTASNFCVQ
jgi:hypothetical protein